MVLTTEQVEILDQETAAIVPQQRASLLVRQTIKVVELDREVFAMVSIVVVVHNMRI